MGLKREMGSDGDSSTLCSEETKPHKVGLRGRGRLSSHLKD